MILIFFFFNDTATTEIYTLSLHDALPIYTAPDRQAMLVDITCDSDGKVSKFVDRSEEHTSELQSQSNLVCRLLLEKKKNKNRLELYSSTHLRTQHQLSLPYNV